MLRADEDQARRMLCPTNGAEDPFLLAASSVTLVLLLVVLPAPPLVRLSALGRVLTESSCAVFQGVYHLRHAEKRPAPGAINVAITDADRRVQSAHGGCVGG